MSDLICHLRRFFPGALALLILAGAPVGCADDAGSDAAPAAEDGLPRADSTVISGARGKADQLDIPATFEEFLEHVFCEADGRVCVVDGDTPISGNMEALRAFYDTRVNPPGQALSVNWTDRGVDLWRGEERFNLSFCVSDDFGEDKEDVLEGTLGAIQDWEDVAHVGFVYMPEEDARCDLDNTDVLFPITPVDDPFASYLARAFFPSSPPDEQDVVVNMPDIRASSSDGMSLRGIMRHELGHVLGFRHEHTRDESGAYYCFEDRNHRPGTSYDSRSVMHYPQCDGDNDWTLELSDLDRVGAAYFYPESGVAQHTRCDEELNADGTVNESCEFTVEQIIEWLSLYGDKDVFTDWMGLDDELASTLAAAVKDRPFLDLEDLRERGEVGDVELRQFYDYLFYDGRCPGAEIDETGWVDPNCYPVVNRILEFVNADETTFEVLDEAVGMDIRAVENLMAATAERPLETYDDLISIGYVKRVALQKLYEHLFEPFPEDDPSEDEED